MNMRDSKHTQAESCPICGRATGKSPIEHSRDYVIYRCSYCGGDFAQTTLSLDYQEQYREDRRTENPVDDMYKLRMGFTAEMHLQEARLLANFKYAIEFLKASQAKVKLLDVGCGVGVFTKLVEELGFEAYALDPAEEAIRYASENFGLKNTVTGTIDDIPSTWRDFNFVTAFEVLEHAEEPRELAMKIYGLLAPGGYFIMSVPNRNRLAIKLRRRESWDYPPHHLIRWSKEALNIFLNDLGFTNVETKIVGIDRFALSNVLLPSKFSFGITTRKVQGSSFFKGFIWKFLQRSGDAAGHLLQKLVGGIYGHYLITFAQKPHSGP